MGLNPVPLFWQGELAAGTTEPVKLLTTGGLFVQAIIISVDNGDIRISDMNFVKMRAFMQRSGAANITQRQFITVQNQYVFPFLNGIVLRDDIEMTLTENGGLEATELSIMVIPARRDAMTQFSKPLDTTKIPIERGMPIEF